MLWVRFVDGGRCGGLMEKFPGRVGEKNGIDLGNFVSFERKVRFLAGYFSGVESSDLAHHKTKSSR